MDTHPPLESPASVPATRPCARDRKAKTPAKFFNPTAFALSVVEAIEPLLDLEKDDLKEGKSIRDVVKSLDLFERYTVSDAVQVLSLLETVASAALITDDETTNDRYSLALSWANRTLETFACTARASSPRCVAARVFLASTEVEGECCLSDWNELGAKRKARVDIVDFRNKFFGDRFGEIDGAWSWLDEHEAIKKRVYANRAAGGQT